MKIGLIIHELLVQGGGERQCIALAQALADQGNEVTLFTSAYDPVSCFAESCKHLRVKEVGRGRLKWLRKPRFVRGYLDMVHLASEIKECHEIWNPHHWPAQWGAVWLKKKLGGVVIWMCNDVPDFHQISQRRKSAKDRLRAFIHWFYYLYDRKQNRSVDLTLFLSNWAEREFKIIYPGLSRVVRSGADPNRFAPGGNGAKIRDRYGYRADEFVLLWLGIMMPHRRLEDAITAVSYLKQRGIKIRLLLAGSNERFPRYFDSLTDLVKTYGLQHEVTFSGKVSDEEIRDFYCASDVFLFPNEHQTWGLAVLEAMASGRPVLVSQGAAVSEVLTDNENAMLFPPRTPTTLADKIELLATHQEMRDKIAENGFVLTRTMYNWYQFAEQIRDVCHELLGTRQFNRDTKTSTDRNASSEPITCQPR